MQLKFRLSLSYLLMGELFSYLIKFVKLRIEFHNSLLFFVYPAHNIILSAPILRVFFSWYLFRALAIITLHNISLYHLVSHFISVRPSICTHWVGFSWFLLCIPDELYVLYSPDHLSLLFRIFTQDESHALLKVKCYWMRCVIWI